MLSILCIVCLLVVVIILSVLLATNQQDCQSNCTVEHGASRTLGRKNATVVLTRGYKTDSEYETFIARNQSIASQTWGEEYEHLVFHEGNITAQQQSYILNHSSIKLMFVSVASLFEESRGCESITSDKCPQNSTFSCGYKTMCRFWFCDFPELCKGYEYVLRVDEDVVLEENSPDPFTIAPLASPGFYGIECQTFAQGMGNFFSSLATELHRTFNPDEVWSSPYTNVLWINVDWARSPDVKFVRDKVRDSQCIMTNRWGDLPLWGALCKLLNVPRIALNLPYFHGSHGCKVSPDPTFFYGSLAHIL
jgi:hypothetical protein